MIARVLHILLDLALIVALPPMLIAVIWKVKAWFGGRDGPGWMQPYRDLRKLWNKSAVYSRTTTWVFRAGPVVNLAALGTAALLVPISGTAAVAGFPGDLIVVAYLLALGKMATVLAALDTGSSFEGMGAAREITFGAMAEPTLFVALAALAIATGQLRLGAMLGPVLAAAWPGMMPASLLIAAALFIVMLTECSRIPVDDPTTHLELTMVHEVMVLDHGGPELAMATFAAALKLLLLGSILLHVAMPLAPWPMKVVALPLLAAVVGVVESTMARLRLYRVPLLLGSALVLAGLAALLVTMGGKA